MQTYHIRQCDNHLSGIVEHEPHRFTAEASTLEWPVGVFPDKITTDMGNGQPFVLESTKVNGDGDLLWVTYKQLLGCITLKVFND